MASAVTILLVVLTAQISLVFSERDKDYILCANSVGFIARIAEDGGPEEISTESPYQKCAYNYCYTLWKEDPNQGSVVIMGQGCWDTSGKPNECDRSECLADKKPPKLMNSTKFCCCSENMCNVNFTDAYVPVEESTPPATELAPKEIVSPLLIAGVSVFLLFLFTLLLLSFYCKWRLQPKKNDVEAAQPAIPSPSDYSLEKLKLLNVIGQGRYGCVWRGIIDDEVIAVKVFSPHHRQYFLNEHEIYKVSGVNSALLKCFGGGEYSIGPGVPTDFLLLLSLEQECLQEYLKNHTLDIATLSKMSLGIAKGLSHLHCDLGKPCIAHRDINTRNILVRSDLSCCICDLGLAVVPKKAENRSLSEAGTLRYMAPEVLEGAVNLRDCESALKQIDVYALGLVLWELGMRCSDMQNGEPMAYQPPFMKEIGENPSLEQMQTLVSRRKARPVWPLSWKDTAAARLLCETAEDCWDQDAEARLTSLCVVERILELPTLKGRILHPMHPPASPTPLINNNHLHDRQIEVSVGTIETLLSPSEENCKNSNHLAACITPLQPHQGRNPCLERNLLSGSSDSLLIDKSLKHCTASESQNLITNDYLNFQINHRATPIPYLQNAVHAIPKQQNAPSRDAPSELITKSAKFKWNGLKKMFSKKKLTHSNHQTTFNTKVVNCPVSGFTTSLLNKQQRPLSLHLNKDTKNCGVAQIMKRKDSERSLERFSEVFSSTSDLSRLKNPADHVKTPGDVPPSVRRTRGKAATDSAARFSLYDDRIMCRGLWGSAPDLEPPLMQRKPQDVNNDSPDRDSVSSF